MARGSDVSDRLVRWEGETDFKTCRISNGQNISKHTAIVNHDNIRRAANGKEIAGVEIAVNSR
jgi:hypothetical protein